MRARDVSYMIVSEAGASVYSASPLAAEEFPDYDVNLRSAVSIARRLQDPLAELVKIDPKAIGVGQYQHDCPPKRTWTRRWAASWRTASTPWAWISTPPAPSLLQPRGGPDPRHRQEYVVAYREEPTARLPPGGQLLNVPKARAPSLSSSVPASCASPESSQCAGQYCRAPGESYGCGGAAACRSLWHALTDVRAGRPLGAVCPLRKRAYGEERRSPGGAFVR